MESGHLRFLLLVTNVSITHLVWFKWSFNVANEYQSSGKPIVYLLLQCRGYSAHSCSLFGYHSSSMVEDTEVISTGLTMNSNLEGLIVSPCIFTRVFNRLHCLFP